jgi:Domain of unknown function (DUF4082)/Bacterial Ig domain
MLNSFRLAVRQSSLRFGALLVIALGGFSGQAHSQCSSPANPIVAENCLPGNPDSEWDVKTADAGDPTIQGFATDISVNQGGTVFFKVKAAHAYSINIYRMGYYQGLGARKVATISPSAPQPQTQPACVTDNTTGLIDCGTWGVSASWAVPSTAVSGIYFAHLVRTDTGGDSHIVFIVRNDASTSAILFQTADETWQAYNNYGNGSLYGPSTNNFDLTSRSYKVSYNRPFSTRGFYPESNTWVFGAEYPMVQWLEQNGYDVSYFTGVDAARSGTLIKNHKLYMDVGHDEYWSGPQRASVQAARDAGVNLAFFSGNEMFWKTRWENSVDGSNTPNRTLVCYKETLAFAKLDPGDPPTWTGTWRDPSFSPPADGGKPENALTGTLFMVNGPGPDNDGSLTIKVPAADGKMRFWRNTAVASLASNATYTLPTATLGYEWDMDVDNGLRPAGAFHLSTTTYPMTSDLLLDYGGVYGAGNATHHLMLYRAPSGALVFSAGSVNWSWGLNSNHDNPYGFTTPTPDTNMQQANVNLFADMGIQPATLISGLTPATASSDTTPPQSNITSPASGATLNTGSVATISGTASDTGGQVGGVEVSTDGGTTWHPATGRAAWSYSWTPTVVGPTTIQSRAVDDSGNLEAPQGGRTLNVAPQVCPCSIWSSSATPATVDGGDAGSVEIGVKFRTDADGSILGVRFYKASTNTGAHIGHVWSSDGTLLGTATFTNESGSGWQQASFTAPIAVTANTTYIVSYFAPSGHYSADPFSFNTAGVDNPPLHALANGVDGLNGVYLYTSSGGFPSSGVLATNYWVDVVFTSSSTYRISGTIAGYGGAGATVTLSGAASSTTTADGSGNYSFLGLFNGSYTVTPSHAAVTFTPTSRNVTISGGIVTGVNFTAVVSSPLSISGTISGGGGSTVQLGGDVTASTIADVSGNYSFTGLLAGNYTVTPDKTNFIFTPGTQTVVLSGSNAVNINFLGQNCNCVSLWQPSDTPSLIDSSDATPVEVGFKFRSDSLGYVTGLRFYKASTNTGTHVGHVWDSSGAMLGSATFTSETASGWQQVTFSSPVLVLANTTYVASYFAPVGHYSASTAYFATTGVDNAPLHALKEGVDGSNGVYLYTSSGGYPINSYQSTNYWVDILFSPAQAYTVSGSITGPGAAGTTVKLSGAANASTVADGSGNYIFTGVYAGAYFVTPSKTGAIFVPGSTSISVNASNVTSVNFTVPQLCPCATIWPSTTLPGLADSGDANPYELGVKFRADTDGYILGVRFYKSALNAGVHKGSLWSTAGSLLSTATFTNETTSGWQQVVFPNPVPVIAGTTYVASYFDPAGRYAVDPAFFATNGVDSPPLHALATGVDGQNGVFTSSSTSVYPSSSSNAANYWVDVIYANAATHSLGGVITGAVSSGVTITLSGPSTAATTSDASGNYSFSGLADGTYVVTPNATGASFSPASQTITISGAHKLGVNFTSGLPTFTVSGTITGGGSGITVSLTGTTTASGVTDVAGHYSVSVPNGSYVVTPSSVGISFSPSSQPATVNGANVSGIDFAATVITYSLSGTISGGAGATVSLAGPTNATTVADSAGNYTFTAVSTGSYTVVPAKAGLVFIPTSQIAAVAGSNVSAVNFSVPAICPCNTIWQPSSGPTITDIGDNQSIEIGVKFRSDADGYIGGIRFYKSSLNVGPHQGNVWSSTGNLLGSATFTNEGSSGWQQVLFAVPVHVSANTTYIASYFAPSGHFSEDTNFFASSGVDSVPLHALASGVDGQNGVYLYGAQSGFPINSFSSSNYWVDVIFTASQTYNISGTISGSAGSGATVNLAGPISATTTADASGAFTFAGAVNGSYTVTPSKAGFTFTPVNQAVTVSGANVTANFATAAFSISGTISGTGGNGATVNLTGASTATTTADASGAYTFTGLANGSYTVTPSKTGFTFTPVNQAATVNGANATANFATSAFSISGTISGTGGNGATVNLTGASTATTTADASGAYTFTGLANGSYTVTPSKAGFTFTPVNQAVTVSGANVTANFATAAFSISGTISGTGGSGATVNLTGASTATATANASGVYTFSGLANGTYTVTPSKAGFTFTPTNQAVTVSGANATANFATSAFSISGTISGTGGNGATVNLTGASTATTTADASGAYTCTGLANGSYTVTPSKAGFTFTPASLAVTVNGANATANFATSAFTISGTISGTGGNGATVNLTGASTATATANASGVYTFSGLANGTYTVTPSKAGFTFTPVNQAVTVSGANATANFATQTYSITGTISGLGGNGATVNLTGASTATATANASGVYTFSGLVNGSYTVTPSKAGFTFTPVNQAVTVNGANATANFATVTYTISGTISGPGGPSATVRLTGGATATVTASGSGVYTFTVTNGNYTITPSKTGYTFTPVNQAVTVGGANVTVNFSSALQTHTITGTISGAGGAGATVFLTGAATTSVVANASGVYSFPGVVNGSYTVTPAHAGFSFTPISRTVTVNGGNATANFSTVTYQISGSISGVGINAVTVTLTGPTTATVTTGVLGRFTFSGITNGTYTVTPSKTGRTYTPTNRSVVVTSSSVGGVTFTAQ